MDNFDYKKYVKNNPLLKENISMEDGEDKITYYAKELIKMHTPGDEKGVEGLLTYLDDNPEEMPSSWDAEFINDPNNFNDIMDKIFELTPMEESHNVKSGRWGETNKQRREREARERSEEEERKDQESKVNENTEFDDDIIELRNDPVFIEQYDTEIYVPPHVRGEDVTVRADSENYRLPVEFLVDMAEKFGDMGDDAMSFVEEAVARFVHIGIAEAEKDKLYNWFDNILYGEGTMSEGFNYKKFLYENNGYRKADTLLTEHKGSKKK